MTAAQPNYDAAPANPPTPLPPTHPGGTLYSPALLRSHPRPSATNTCRRGDLAYWGKREKAKRYGVVAVSPSALYSESFSTTRQRLARFLLFS